MRLVALLLVCAVATACGSSSPAAPSRSTNAIDVVVPDALRVGETGGASATARFSDGTSSAVTTGWRSDNASVASVTDAGVITALGSGQATIYVVSGGRQGQKVLTVVPDFSGQWAGTFTIASCQISGGWNCTSTAAGLVVNITASFVQTGRRVTGQVTFGTRVTEPGEGSVGNDGLLLFNATFTGTNGDNVVTVTPMLSPAPGQIVAGGQMVHRWTNPGTAGERLILSNMTALARR